MSTALTAAAPTKPIDWTALIVVIVIFALVAALGFLAARWRVRPAERGLKTLDEWGLAGRGFGSWITWFLLGGDLYTAYTFIAVPAAMWGTGAVTGFFAVPCATRGCWDARSRRSSRSCSRSSSR